MSKLARKLVLSVLTVVLTVIALGTTTFAWFTLTNTTVIQPFEVEVTASTGFQMALGTPDAGFENELTWVNVLTATDIAAYIQQNYGTLRLNAVTTADGSNFYSVDMSAATPASTGAYLTLPLNFRSQEELQIQVSAITFPGALNPTFSWTADQPFVTAQNQSVSSGNIIEGLYAPDAVRVAFVGVQVGGAGSLPVLAYELPGSETNVYLGGGSTPLDLSDLVALNDDNLGAAGNLNYYAAKNGGVLPFGSNAVTVLETITSIANNPIYNLQPLATSGQAYYGRVLLRVWIEGWDANMYDPLLSAKISVSFSFIGV